MYWLYWVRRAYLRHVLIMLSETGLTTCLALPGSSCPSGPRKSWSCALVQNHDKVISTDGRVNTQLTHTMNAQHTHSYFAMPSSSLSPWALKLSMAMGLRRLGRALKFELFNSRRCLRPSPGDWVLTWAPTGHNKRFRGGPQPGSYQREGERQRDKRETDGKEGKEGGMLASLSLQK